MDTNQCVCVCVCVREISKLPQSGVYVLFRCSASLGLMGALVLSFTV